MTSPRAHNRRPASQVALGGASLPSDESVESRIGKLVDVQPNGCWIFNGTPDKYGRAYVGQGRQVVVHRFVYETLIGPIPAGHHLHHTCHTEGCCNPLHLVALTQRQHSAEHTLERMENDSSTTTDLEGRARHADLLERRAGRR